MPPIQRLELVDRLFPALFTGEKRDTIRWNEGPVTTGYLIYEASNNPRWKTLVWVTKVSEAPLGSLAPHYGQTPEQLTAAMRRHYPTITAATPVLFVEHLTPQETLARYGVPEGLDEVFPASEEELYSSIPSADL